MTLGLTSDLVNVVGRVVAGVVLVPHVANVNHRADDVGADTGTS